jgi:hypothetical protein
MGILADINIRSNGALVPGAKSDGSVYVKLVPTTVPFAS